MLSHRSLFHPVHHSMLSLFFNFHTSLFISGTVRAVGVYPLNMLAKTKDISFGRNPPGIWRNIKPAAGPDGSRGTSYEFFGRANSFITFPNRGKLDTRKSITILAWIYHQGKAGPIFNYNPRAWGVHFWMVAPGTLFVRFTRRGTRDFTTALLSRSVKPNTWQYVGTTYDQSSGVAKLYVNGRTVARKKIGRIQLATNYPARMGARIGDGRYFRGRISCLQVYSVALSANQIAARDRRCFVPGTFQDFFITTFTSCSMIFWELASCLHSISNTNTNLLASAFFVINCILIQIHCCFDSCPEVVR